MVARPNFRRAKDFKRGVLAGFPPAADLKDLAPRVRYLPDGKHKSYPDAAWSFVPDSDGTRCQRIAPDAWPKLNAALHDAFITGSVDTSRRGLFPSRAWAYVNGVLHEARLSNQDTGEYHGFPLDYEEHFPHDPDERLPFAPRIDL